MSCSWTLSAAASVSNHRYQSREERMNEICMKLSMESKIVLFFSTSALLLLSVTKKGMGRVRKLEYPEKSPDALPCGQARSEP